MTEQALDDTVALDKEAIEQALIGQVDLSKTDAALLMGRSRPTIYEYIRKGVLKTNKTGRITKTSFLEAI